MRKKSKMEMGNKHKTRSSFFKNPKPIPPLTDEERAYLKSISDKHQEALRRGEFWLKNCKTRFGKVEKEEEG